MPEYQVTWVIDIVADDPELAAREARKVQRDPDSLAGVFQVVNEEGTIWEVDLDAPRGERVSRRYSAG